MFLEDGEEADEGGLAAYSSLSLGRCPLRVNFRPFDALFDLWGAPRVRLDRVFGDGAEAGGGWARPTRYLSAIKRLAKRILHQLGYDVRRVGSLRAETPSWIRVTPDFRHTERMANRSYRPPRVKYERMPRGGDARVKYLLYFMDFRDLRVLELGPRDGHQTIMLEKMGAREIVALEGRRENLEHCLRTKERYGLDRTSFHLADIEALADGRLPPPFEGTFDLVFCAGLLYHLREPARMLEWCRRQAQSLFLQTHYVEEAASARYWASSFRETKYRHGSHEYRAKIFEEDPGNPRSGLAQTSVWLYERDLLALIERAGFEQASVLGKDVHGALPHITILAESSVSS